MNRNSKDSFPNLQEILLMCILLAFAVASVYVALSLAEGIIPDKPAHFIFSKVYAITWFLPR